MSLYVISDLHLSQSVDKSMEVFGARWTGYTEKINRNWRAVICDDDTVIVPGDISWASSLEDALPDLLFIDALPGRKLIGKGNHDFWWSTLTKIRAFFEKNGIKTIDILYNNAYELEDFIVCGTRGWFNDEKQQSAANDADYDKIVAREAGRLEISLKEAKELQKKSGYAKKILVFLHFPPVWGDYVCNEIISVLKEYDITKCYFGHIHGNYTAPRVINYDGIDFVITSADYLQFCPMPIWPEDQ